MIPARAGTGQARRTDAVPGSAAGVAAVVEAVRAAALEAVRAAVVLAGLAAVVVAASSRTAGCVTAEVALKPA
jgi:hypothetical protein